MQVFVDVAVAVLMYGAAAGGIVGACVGFRRGWLGRGLAFRNKTLNGLNDSWTKKLALSSTAGALGGAILAYCFLLTCPYNGPMIARDLYKNGWREVDGFEFVRFRINLVRSLPQASR